MSEHLNDETLEAFQLKPETRKLRILSPIVLIIYMQKGDNIIKKCKYRRGSDKANNFHRYNCLRKILR